MPGCRWLMKKPCVSMVKLLTQRVCLAALFLVRWVPVTALVHVENWKVEPHLPLHSSLRLTTHLLLHDRFPAPNLPIT